MDREWIVNGPGALTGILDFAPYAHGRRRVGRHRHPEEQAARPVELAARGGRLDSAMIIGGSASATLPASYDRINVKAA
jgi:hypothetical protein